MTNEYSTIVEALLSLPIFHSEWVLYLLLGLSLASIAVMAERWVFYLRRNIDVTRLQHDFAQALDAGDFERAAKTLSAHDVLETRVVLAGLRAYEKGPESVEDLIAGSLGRERALYERRLGFLATLASNAPYIGLFGTVLGIVRAFRDLAANMSEASSAVMAGIAEALIATAVGLVVAIPAVIAYNLCKARVQRSVTDCQSLARVLLAELKADELGAREG